MATAIDPKVVFTLHAIKGYMTAYRPLMGLKGFDQTKTEHFAHLDFCNLLHPLQDIDQPNSSRQPNLPFGNRRRHFGDKKPTVCCQHDCHEKAAIVLSY